MAIVIDKHFIKKLFERGIFNLWTYDENLITCNDCKSQINGRQHPFKITHKEECLVGEIMKIFEKEKINET